MQLAGEGIMSGRLIVLVLSTGLAAFLGFAAHRAGICTVKVVEEALTTRRAYMLSSFAKTILWTMVITSLLIWVFPSISANVTGWRVSIVGIAGGILFGVGAAVNGGCAISTLTRLSSGQLTMTATLAGLSLGMLSHSWLMERGRVTGGSPADALLRETTAPVLLGVLSIWAVWEVRRIWRARPAGQSLRVLALSERYTLSATALVLGISNAILYALHGRWAYTTTLRHGVDGLVVHGSQTPVTSWVLAIAFIAGMVVSAAQRRSFRPIWRPALDWLRHGIGGALMGFGAALAPGGNDELLLHGIPILSPHAVPVFIAMLGGIWMTLEIVRLCGGTIVRIDCSGDQCRG